MTENVKTLQWNFGLFPNCRIGWLVDWLVVFMIYQPLLSNLMQK